MNLLFSCIGKRGYIADYFRPHLGSGDRIIGTGNSRWTPGFASCDVSFLLPDIESEDYVGQLLDLCEREDVDALLSFYDPDVYLLSQASELLRQRGVLPLLPGPGPATVAYDKYRMYEFLQGEGVATPRTATSVEGSCGFRYPIYVKPRKGSGSRATYRARNESEARVFFDSEPDMVVQEEVSGEHINFDLCGDLEGRPVGICAWRNHRSVLGETERAETFRDPEVIEFGLDLAELLRITGPMDIDTIRCDGSLFVLDINPRFGGGYPVSHLAGADFPALLLQLVREGQAEPHVSYAEGVVMMKRLGILGGKADGFFDRELRIR